MTEENIKKLQDLLRKKDMLENFIEFQDWGVVAIGQHCPKTINEKGFDVAPGAIIEDKEFDDELDEYLFENHQVKSGCCSSVENLKYQIAREVAEKMIEEFNINIQYISQEERRKKMNEMYGINSIK